MNLEENPVLALSFWVTEERDGKAITNEGYQLKGTAHFEDSGRPSRGCARMSRR
jgi:hypothetical protein